MLLTEHPIFLAIALLLLPEILRSTTSRIFGGIRSYTNVQWSISSIASQLSLLSKYARSVFLTTHHPFFRKHSRQQGRLFFLRVTDCNAFPQYPHFVSLWGPMNTVNERWRYCVTCHPTRQAMAVSLLATALTSASLCLDPATADPSEADPAETDFSRCSQRSISCLPNSRKQSAGM